MAFGDMFKNSSFAPGSAEFKRMLGLSVDENARVAAGDSADDDIMIISKSEYRRATGVDIKTVLGTGVSTAPAATPTPTPAPTGQPASGGIIVVNPLLDLDLAPVRPGDLITAASFNALIAACAALHVRLSVLEAKSGSATPTPTPTTTPTPTPGASTPPVTRLPPDLKTAYVASQNRSTKELTTIFASGLRLDALTDARLLYYDANKRRTGSTTLKNRRTTNTVAIFNLGVTPRSFATAFAVELEVTSAEGKDSVVVERPTTALREALEAKLRSVDDPLDLIDDFGKNDVILKSSGVGVDPARNLR
ncbi:hypothetical protein [Sandarakinorhabdus oryzae]|uniref:hypothetical protein n=1 Tax=Sandarakinorhabdus oryzae TaxID=2675220 RepID=UPI0012E28FC5|nr:hypothetical protein [Sandarakinorhabdus oryzae]